MKKKVVVKPKIRKGAKTVLVERADWEALVIRSKTLAALREGSGLPCTKCGECLMVKDRCPGCGNRYIISET